MGNMGIMAFIIGLCSSEADLMCDLKVVNEVQIEMRQYNKDDEERVEEIGCYTFINPGNGTIETYPRCDMAEDIGVEKEFY